MAGLSDQLQSYLTKSSDSLVSANSNASSKMSNAMSWFSRSSEASTEPEISGEASDSWFSKANNDPCLPSLTRKQRILGFVGCVFMGILCFVFASLYMPFLILKARKFALMYSLGSLFFIFSFSMLWGPVNHIKHLCSGNRLPFTIVYFGTLFGTLYAALSMRSTIFTVFFAVLQIIALVWYIVSYIPGGQTGLKFFSKIFYSATSTVVKKTLPV